MCLSIPARIESVEGHGAVAEVAGNRIEVNVSLLDDLAPGDYVMVHAGFAISRYDPEEARATLALWGEVGALSSPSGDDEARQCSTP